MIGMRSRHQMAKLATLRAGPSAHQMTGKRKKPLQNCQRLRLSLTQVTAAPTLVRLPMMAPTMKKHTRLRRPI
ncbi:hypothetical protein Lpp221_13429 [Lacticaseibacillus paracasei subsp. paracasei Lpp221]|nr:hypothetical protein Lpp221_13429 [Lacticaseibacillus paracasei subsp. paracasei Lpp221]